MLTETERVRLCIAAISWPDFLVPGDGAVFVDVFGEDSDVAKLSHACESRRPGLFALADDLRPPFPGELHQAAGNAWVVALAKAKGEDLAALVVEVFPGDQVRQDAAFDLAFYLYGNLYDAFADCVFLDDISTTLEPWGPAVKRAVNAMPPGELAATPLAALIPMLQAMAHAGEQANEGRRKGGQVKASSEAGRRSPWVEALNKAARDHLHLYNPATGRWSNKSSDVIEKAASNAIEAASGADAAMAFRSENIERMLRNAKRSAVGLPPKK